MQAHYIVNIFSSHLKFMYSCTHLCNYKACIRFHFTLAAGAPNGVTINPYFFGCSLFLASHAFSQEASKAMHFAGYSVCPPKRFDQLGTVSIKCVAQGATSAALVTPGANLTDTLRQPHMN